MSHWTKIKTKINSSENLKKALGRMGIAFEEGEFNIQQYEGSEKCQLKVDSAVGFSRQEDGSFAMVGDFYHSSKLRRFYGGRGNENFTEELNTAYAVAQTTDELESQGFACTSNSEAKVGQDGLIRMTYERY